MRLTKSLSTIKFTPRLEIVKAICGVWIFEKHPLEGLWEKENESRKNKKPFAKFLSGLELPETFAKELIDSHNASKFVVSCRYNDILRCGISRNYTSCLAPDRGNSHVPRHYAQSEPGMVVAFTADKSGKFSNRVLLNVQWTDQGPSLGVFRPYGEVSVCKKIVEEILTKTGWTVHRGQTTSGTYADNTPTVFDQLHAKYKKVRTYYDDSSGRETVGLTPARDISPEKEKVEVEKVKKALANAKNFRHSL